MNKERMLALAADMASGDLEVDGEAVSFNMMSFVGVKYDGENPCGTSCCIAGYVWLKHGPFTMDEAFSNRRNVDWFARKYLELNDVQAHRLFYGNIIETDPKKGACAILRLMEGKDPWREEKT